MMKLLILILTTFTLVAVPIAAQVFVSPSGDDQAAGGFQHPFETLERAQLEVRELRRKHPEQAVTVTLREGIYRLHNTLVFGPEDGGDADHSVVWCSAANETVILSGGRRIKDWVMEEGVYRAHLPKDLAGLKVSDLYRGLLRAQHARHPNNGWLRVDEVGADRRTSFTFAKDQVPALDSIEGVRVHLLHDWSTSRIPLAHLDAAAGTLSTRAPIGCAAPHYAINNFEAHPRFALEGHPAFLDQEGEWCQDPASGDLMLLPRTVGRLPNAPPDPEASGVQLPVLERLMEWRGEVGRPVQNLHFLGIQFRHAAFVPPQEGWAGAQASMHERRDGSDAAAQRVFVPAAIHIEDTVASSLEACTMAGLGGSAVWIGPGCQDVTLRGCTIQNIGANGINIGEDSARQIDGQPWWRSSPPDDPRLARRINIEGCTIKEAGQVYAGAVGIWIGFAADCRVSYNDIHDLPYTGVSVGWVWAQDPSPSGGHHIEHNNIYRVMQLLSDGGCIYTLGRQPGTVLRNNYLHEVPDQAGRAPSNAIFVDEGSSEMVIEGNLIDGIAQAPIRFHRAGKNLVRNNVLITARHDPYQYNRTDPTDISSIDNQVRPQRVDKDLEIQQQAGSAGYQRNKPQAKD